MNGNKGIQRLSIFIMVLALTVLACQGVGGFNPFATATPTPTLTFTPTLTPSPTPSPVPTDTPTATPPAGKVKEEQSDGTTLFTDYDGKYQVVFPKGWTVVILEEGDIDEVLNSIPEQEKNVSEMIDSLKKSDVNKLIRAVAYNFKAQQGRYTPNLNISYDTNPLYAALPLKDLVDATVSYFPSLNIKVINSEMKKTSSGIEIGVIEAQWTMKVSSSQKLDLEQKQIFFKSGKGVAVITLSMIKGAKVNLSSDLEKMIESVQLLE